MRVAVRAVCLTSLFPSAVLAQELAAGPAAMLAAETWSGTVSGFVADTTRSADGEIQEIVSRSFEGSIRFTDRESEGAVGVNAKWTGVGEVSWRVDDREITIVPGKAAITQTLEGSGRVSLNGQNSVLQILARQGVYDLSLDLQPFEVDLVTEGGAMEEPMRMRTRPQRRAGGLGGSVRRVSLPAAGLVLEGSETLRDGTVLGWRLSPGDATTVADEEEAPAPSREPASPSPDAAPPTTLALPLMSMNSPAEREAGTAWFDDRWERSYSIEEVEVIPPDGDKDFRGLDHTLVIQIMGEDGGWTKLAEAPVTPQSAQGTGGWEKHHPNQFNPEYFVIRLVKSFEPVAVRGIRFELNGAKAMGGGWTFWVRAAPQPAAVGETRHEWRYTHVW